MPKIFIDDFEEFGCDYPHKHFFNKHTKIYPIDYSYCKEYIKLNSNKNGEYRFNFYYMTKWFLLESFLVVSIINNELNDLFVESFVFLSVNLFINMIYMMFRNQTPSSLYEFGYEESCDNKRVCYSCGVVINIEGKESIENRANDFEFIYLACGHLHHTACLTSKFVQNTLNHNDPCNYCNSERSLNVLSPIIGDAYYASILAYDLKNNDHINEIKQSNYKMLRRSERIKRNQHK